MINEKINESVMLSGNIFLEDSSIVNLNATITTETAGYPNISVGVMNGKAYASNKEAVDEKIMAFMMRALSKQADLHTEEEPAV